MTRGQVAAKVRAAKEEHPERYCSARGCLWRVTSGPCRNHGLRVASGDERVAELVAAYAAAPATEPGEREPVTFAEWLRRRGVADHVAVAWRALVLQVERYS